MRKRYTSESVTIGHPDKMSDLISDAILDDCIKNDKNAKVACEVMGVKDKVIIGGEITSTHKPDYEKIVKDVLKEIGYDFENLEVLVFVNKQSPEINEKVSNSLEYKLNKNEDVNNKLGAGDQGIMYGYACSEIDNKIPPSLDLARKITNRLTYVRQNNVVKGLMPDGKVQVTISLIDNEIKVEKILISTQHKEEVDLIKLRNNIKKHVINHVFQASDIKPENILINPCGSFITGGFEADTGLTGRKLQVDTYGGISRHGGGAFSGKDPSKVDRSAAYMARYIAKNIVTSGVAKRCEVTIAYAIGKSMPLDFSLNFFNTQSSENFNEKYVEHKLKQVIDLRPSSIIKRLDLLNPIYKDATMMYNFGNNNFSWEKLDLVSDIKRVLNT